MDWQVQGKIVTAFLLFTTAVTALDFRTALDIVTLPYQTDRYARDIARRDAAAQSTSVSGVVEQLQIAMRGQCSLQEYTKLLGDYGRPVGNECEAAEATCLPRCLDPMVKTFIKCKSVIGLEMVAAECGSNEKGSLCLTVLLKSLLDLPAGVAACQRQMSSSECSSACREALVDIKNDFGCCFGNYYNSSSAISTRFLASAAPIKSLSSYQLWHACGVETVGMCLYTLPANATLDYNLTSAPGTADKPQDTESSIIETALGKCSPDEFDAIASGFGDFNGSGCENPEKLCEPMCREPIIKTMEKCESDSKLVQVECQTNEKGQLCLDALLSSMLDIVGLTLCRDNTGPHACSSECKQALMKVKENLGCCFNGFYNSTLITSSIILPNVTSYSLWKSCEVDTPGICRSMSTQEPGDSESRSRRPNFYYGPLIALLVVVGCAVAVVVFLRRRKLSIAKRMVLPKVLSVGRQGYAYRKLTHEEEAELQDENMQTEL